MNHAKRMVLVDEQLLESLKSRSWEKPIKQLIQKQETKDKLSWRKPADVRAKTNMHLTMKAIAEDASVSDDVKAKLYGQALAKFRRMNTKPAKINNEQSNTVVAADASDNNTVNNLIDFDTVVSPPKKQKKTKKRHSTEPYAPALRSIRSYKRKAMKVSDMDFIEI